MRLAALAVLAAVAAAPVPPAPTHWVEDHAGFISPAARDVLDGKLAAYERETGHQVVVWIGTTLDGAPLDEWAVRTFEAWKVGRKGLDDGIVLFVLATDRKIDIEVGYGLEDKVTDAMASRIIRDVMVPKIRAGDHDGALIAGTDALLAAIEGKPWSGSGAPPGATEPRPITPAEWIGGGVVALLVLYLLIRHPRLAFWILLSMFGRGGGGFGGGGGGGGFSGGGGRSGGGGARGGW